MDKKDYYEKLYADRQKMYQKREIERQNKAIDREIEKAKRERSFRNRNRVKVLRSYSEPNNLYYLFLALLFFGVGSAFVAKPEMNYIDIGNQLMDSIKLFINSVTVLSNVINGVISFLKIIYSRIMDLITIVDKFLDWTN